MIAKLDGRGWSLWQIKDELKRVLAVEISNPMVCIYRKQIYAEATKDYADNKKNNLAIKLEQLKDVRREAWLAYDRSMLDAEKVVTEFGNQTEQVGFDDYVTSEVMLKRIE